MFVGKILSFIGKYLNIFFSMIGKDLKGRRNIKQFRENKKRHLNLNDEI
jgi:hypothetical protein